MKTCPVCGHENESALFPMCRACGSEVEQTDSEEGVLDALEALKRTVYTRARMLDEHEFAAFSALMAAYIDLRRWELSPGAERFPSHKGRYIGEKVATVFGRWLLRDPEMMRLFLAQLGVAQPKDEAR